MRVHGPLLEVLEGCGLSWEVRNGGKHNKLFIAGRLVQVLPRSPRTTGHHADSNCLAAVRRWLRLNGHLTGSRDGRT